MRPQELRERTDEELRDELVRLAKEQFHLRMQRANGQLGQTHLIREARRDIARVKTVMLQKRRALQSQTVESENNE